MKTKISRIGKKSLSVIIALMMIVSTMLVGMVSVSASITGYSAIYFTPSSNWRQDKAIFKLEVDSNKIDFVCVDETNYIYKATLDSNTTYNDLKFLRINPNNTSETWNSSNKFSWISDDKSLNHYTMKDNASWSSWDVNTNNGTWSAYSGGSGETTKDYYYSYNEGSNKFVKMEPDSKYGGYVIRVNKTNRYLNADKKFKIADVDNDSDDKLNNGTHCVNYNIDINTVEKSTSLTSVNFEFDNTWKDLYIKGTSLNDFYIQYTPGGTNGLAGKIKVWSVSDYDGSTEPTTTQPVETTVPPTTAPSGAYKITDATTDLNGSLSFSASGGTAAGTANSGDIVTITGNPVKSYFDLDTVTVTGEDNSSIPVSGTGDTRTFTMPAQNVTATATFKLNKPAYIQSLNEDGLWIDVAPVQYDTAATLIKWNNYSGNNHGTNDYYTFYVPKNVDLANAKVYNGFDSEVKLNGVSIPANSCNTAPLSITPSETNYTTSGGTTSPVKVMQGSTNAMFLYTTKGDAAYSLPTKTGAGETKDSVESDGGSCKTMTDTTDTAKQFSVAMALDSVKGRGNSSWEASYKFFGKYAFNMKLGSKTKLFGMDSAKSWCLLANNADESMLRNALTYQLAAEIGIQDSPEFRFVDIYDNGEYLGSYLVTEKVDVGKNKLVKGESFEDLNEKGAEADGAKEVSENTEKSTYSYGSSTYSMQYAKVSPNGVTSDSAKYPSETKGKYLLEFEIRKRLFPSDGNENNKSSEASWFKSPKGQYVVVKSPEFATKEQVTYIAQKFAAMEAMIFTSGATKAQLSTVMDVESFAKMYLIQEFTANLDAASTSYYITFDCSQTNPVFVANPVWDYDMALGQFKKEGYKFTKDGTSLSPAKTDAWLAKYKRMDDSEEKAPKEYSIQSQLASQNSAFKTEIRKQWEGTNGFYTKIQKYIGDNGQIKKTWFDNINASAEMNETRWGFIRNDLLSEANAKWGVKNTGANHTEAVNYLNNWVTERALWLNGEFRKDSEYAPYTPSKPTIAAYNSDLTATISQVDYGASFVIKVTPEIESGVKYRLYEGSSTDYLENSDGVFVVNATEAGTKTYTVKAVYGTTESEISNSVTVKVNSVPVAITGVSISTPKTTVNVDEEFTLTATASPSGLTGVTYTFYKDGKAIPEATDIEYNTFTTTITSAGSAMYKVVATLNGKPVESDLVTVTAKTASVTQDVTIYFKTATAPAYAPSVSFDDGNATAMTKSSDLGKDYSGALTFAWYSVEIQNVDTTKTHTLTFTSKRTKLNATWNGTLTKDSYFTADNLMSGTVAVNLTDKSVAERNFFYSATNMVYDSTDAKNKTLGFTYYGGARVKMGSVVNDSNGTVTAVSAPTVKSATYIQMVNASMITVSSLQSELYDVNFDGKVDIKDATYIQYALAS